MNNWKETTLGEIIKLNYGKSLSSVNREKGSVPVYGSSGITGYHSSFLVNEEGLIIGRKGTVGSVYKSKTPFFPIDTVFFIKKSEAKCDWNFLWYLLKSLKLERLNFDAVVPGLNREVAYAEPIYIPDKIEKQKQIAGVLSSLDDKIELLRAENETLEKIAEGIFKEWFVNFNFPVLNYDVNDSMMDYDLELKNNHSQSKNQKNHSADNLPEGWKVGKLGDVLSLEYGKSLKEEDRTGKGYSVFGSNGIVGYHKDFLVKGDGIVVGRKGTMGAVIWVESDFFPIDTAFYVKDRLGVDKLFFHYLLLLRQNFEKVGSDSAVPGLNRNSAYSISTVIPEISVINYFHEIIEPTFSKIKLNNLQIQTLSRLRDTLLPKLMSGEVRILQKYESNL